MSGNNKEGSGTSLFQQLCGKKDSCPAANKCCGEENNNRCPPMPCFNTGDCKPAWLCSPDKDKTKTYPVPAGVKIIPISRGGRNGSPVGGSSCSAKCSACGRSDDPKGKSPNVGNKDCPMVKARCPSKAPPAPEKKESGLFSKISSFFEKK